MITKSKKNQILIKLTGADVSPETVRARDLAEFLVQFETAILETVAATKKVPPEIAAREWIVSLLKIERGSESLTFALSGEVIDGASLLSLAHYSRDYSQIPFKAQEALHKISSQATENFWNVEFVEDKGLNIKSAVISAENPVPLPRIAKVQGDTTIYGKLIRVGGVEPRAMLQMPDRNYIYIALKEEMALSLASKERLYKQVGIEGTATWRVDTMELLDFKAKRITAYQPHNSNLVETFTELAKSAGGRWDELDAEKFVAELRGREKQ
jgi:hypothetical protein